MLKKYGLVLAISWLLYAGVTLAEVPLVITNNVKGGQIEVAPGSHKEMTFTLKNSSSRDTLKQISYALLPRGYSNVQIESQLTTCQQNGPLAAAASCSIVVMITGDSRYGKDQILIPQACVDDVQWCIEGAAVHINNEEKRIAKVVMVGAGNLAFQAKLDFDANGALSSTHVSGHIGKNWQAITYADGQFIAVGGLGQIKTSPAGDSWTSQLSPTTHELDAITYGAGRFVAVGNRGVILTSVHGTNWTEQVSPTTQDLRGIVYAAGKFTAVGFGGTVLRSTDGLEWTREATGYPSDDLYGIAYGAGKWIAVGAAEHQGLKDYQDVILRSSDGVTWQRYLPAPGAREAFSSVIYANGNFVTTGASGVWNTYYSADGVSWTAADKNSPGCGINVNSVCMFTFMHLAYSPVSRQFIAVGENGAIFSSPHGMEWSDHSAAMTTASLFGVAVNSQGKLVAVGDAGEVATAVDSVNWVLNPVGTSYHLNSVAHAKGLFVAVGRDRDWPTGFWMSTMQVYGPVIETSTDGEYWVTNYLNPNDPTLAKADLNQIVYGAGRWVAMGHEDLNTGPSHASMVPATFTVTSTDGKHWVKQAPLMKGGDNYLSSIVYAQGRFVAVGSAIFTSIDGLHWLKEQVPEVSSLALNSIRYADGHFIAVGDNQILTSSDGLHWSVKSLGNDKTRIQLHSVGYGNGLWLAFGLSVNMSDPNVSTSKNIILRSSNDGVSWKQTLAPAGIGGTVASTNII